MAFDRVFEGPPTTGAPASASLAVDLTNRTLYIGGGSLIGWQEIVAASGAPTGPAGGDLSGMYPNPTVDKVNGASIPISATLLGTNSIGQLIAESGAPPTGTAGGDLSGTYPNPVVDQVNGAAVPMSATVVGTNGSGQLVSVTVSPAATHTPIQELPTSGALNGVNKVFTSSLAPVTSLPYQLLYNGQILFPTTDFTVTGSTWTLVNIAPISTDSVYFNYWHA